MKLYLVDIYLSTCELGIVFQQTKEYVLLNYFMSLIASAFMEEKKYLIINKIINLPLTVQAYF